MHFSIQNLFCSFCLQVVLFCFHFSSGQESWMNYQSWENSMTQTLWSWWPGLSKRIFSLFQLNAICVDLMFLVIVFSLFVTAQQWTLVTHEHSQGGLSGGWVWAAPCLGSVSLLCSLCIREPADPFAPRRTQFSQPKEVNLEVSRFSHHITATSLH